MAHRGVEVGAVGGILGRELFGGLLVWAEVGRRAASRDDRGDCQGG